MPEAERRMTMEPTEAPTYEYTQFPRKFLSYRWYKPLLVALLTFVLMTIFQIALLIVVGVWAGDPGIFDSLAGGYDSMDVYTGPGALLTLGSVAVMLAAFALALLIVRDRPFSSCSSSRGGWNWGVFFKSIALAVGVYAASILVANLPIFGVESASASAPGEILFTAEGIVLCILLIPLQCLAEEYVFRGFIMQTIGSWTKLPLLAVIVSAAVFAAGHPYNLIGVVTIFINGLVWGVIVWQTRGLEATSAIHIVNNTQAFVYGGLGIEAITSEIDVVSMVIAAVTNILYAVVVIYLGKKHNWFVPKGDGATKFNEKYQAKIERKQARKQARNQARGASPEPPTVESRSDEAV